MLECPPLTELVFPLASLVRPPLTERHGLDESSGAAGAVWFLYGAELVASERILAGHDVSDGGLVTTLLEMAFAGNCGLSVDLKNRIDGAAIEAMLRAYAGTLERQALRTPDQLPLPHLAIPNDVPEPTEPA